MNDFQEKIAFSLAAAFSTAFSTLGAMFTTGETRPIDESTPTNFWT